MKSIPQFIRFRRVALEDLACDSVRCCGRVGLEPASSPEDGGRKTAVAWFHSARTSADVAMNLVAPLIVCLSLTAGLVQTRPDFTGKWTRIPAAAGEPIEILTLTQTQDTLTVEDMRGRWVQKLDGTESKHVTMEGKPPRESVQVSTSKWEGDALVTLFPIQSSPEGPFLLRVAMSLDGKTLVVRATSTSQTGVVIREETKRYSK